MSTGRFLGALKITNSAPKLLVRGDGMVLGVTGSSLLTGAATAAATLKTSLDLLRTKQAAVKTGGPPARAARDLARDQVKLDMQSLLAVVQQIADANPSQAEAVLTAAGMFVRQVTVRTKPDLAIFQGTSSGMVNVRAKSRGRGTTYWWAVSTDEKAWTVQPLPTKKAKTSFANLTPGTTYFFRFQTFNASGMSDWSQIISFMVK
jgi:hypothetical protein